MSISSASINVGAAVAATGGVATGVVSKGNTLNSHRTILDEGNAFALQTEIDFSVKDPTPSASAPGGYTQARRKLYVKLPWNLASGERTVDTAVVEINVNPECSDARMAEIRAQIAQLIVDADFDGFYNDGSVA